MDKGSRDIGKGQIELAKAIGYADRFCSALIPVTEKTIVVGSVRRKKPIVGDIEVCCVAKYDNRQITDTLFGGTELVSLVDEMFGDNYPGIIANGSRLKKFYYPKKGLSIELYIPNPDDFGRIVAIRTGPLEYSRNVLAYQWTRMGWVGTENGLRMKRECIKNTSGKWVLKIPDVMSQKPPRFETEMDFFNFLEIGYIDPVMREGFINSQLTTG